MDYESELRQEAIANNARLHRATPRHHALASITRLPTSNFTLLRNGGRGLEAWKLKVFLSVKLSLDNGFKLLKLKPENWRAGLVTTFTKKIRLGERQHPDVAESGKVNLHGR